MTEKEKGQVFAEYWVRCGLCRHEAILDARKRRIAVEEVRERGWRRTHEDGWICPTCHQHEADKEL